jgi:hypothetical protein
MGDITQLLANAADTKADFDFGKLNKSYWEGKDQFAKNELRDAFREGVPLGPDGQPDFAAMAKTLFQKGGLEQGVAASNLDVSRQQLKTVRILRYGSASLKAVDNRSRRSCRRLRRTAVRRRPLLLRSIAEACSRVASLPRADSRPLRRAARRSWVS